MPLQITGRHMTVTEAQKQYIDKKVGRLRRLCPKIDELSFTLTKEKINYRADATLRAGSIAVQGSVTASQPLEAIDVLVDKIETQVTKTKDRRQDRSEAARGKAALQGQAIAPVIDEAEDGGAEAVGM
jgi:putative sigma-54 modulation protein